MNKRHDNNRKMWDIIAPQWKLRDKDKNWQKCHLDPTLGFERKSFDLVNRYVGALSAKTACVLGSGDNYAAFALAGLGADVTSVDISEAQLNIAAERAKKLGLNINFVQGDVTNIASLEKNYFDFVCSTNGVIVWITDPKRYFSEASRILKPKGIFMSYDIHPFQRPWKDSTLGQLEMKQPYFDSAPKEYLFNLKASETLGLTSEISSNNKKDLIPIFKCSWTLSELIMAIIEAKFELIHLLEEPDNRLEFWQENLDKNEPNHSLLDWQNNPLIGLPVWLTLVARKK